jgi:hypothetical protein
MTFHVIGETGLSTGDAGLAGQHRESGFETTEEEEIEVMTLAEICRRHAAPIIHFLKIDVEGMEAAVLRGADFIHFRPRIVLLEATSPNSTVPTHEAWEPFLLAAGYRFLWFDGLNRFYAAAEQYDSMAPHFQVPPNVFDRFVRAAENRLAAEFARAQTELAGLRERIAAAGSAASPPGA